MALVSASVMPWNWGASSLAVAVWVSESGLLGTVAVVLSVRVTRCQYRVLLVYGRRVVKLTDGASIALDLRKQLVKLIGLGVELAIGDDRASQRTGGKGKEGEGDGLHCDCWGRCLEDGLPKV